MAREFRINKLSDEFGQYTLVLKCSECGHERTAEPNTLGRLCGWDAKLTEVEKSDVFIQYASQDLAVANAMVATLEKGGPQVRTYGVDLD
jgi:hypothetical protein